MASGRYTMLISTCRDTAVTSPPSSCHTPPPMTPPDPPDQVGDVLRGEQRLQELGRDVGVGWGAALTPRLRGGHRHHLQVLVLVVLAQRRLWGGDMGGGYGGDAVMMPGALGGPRVALGGPKGHWEDPRGYMEDLG